MRRLAARWRSFALAALVLAIGVVFGWVVLRSGPLAPIAVTVAEVEARPVSPALFGIGTVEARYSYRIGPTIPGRVARITVDVGDRVRAGDVLAEMDAVDLDARVAALDAAIARADAAASIAAAQVNDALARNDYARAQVVRYEELWRTRVTSEATVDARRQDARVAEAALTAARSGLLAAQKDLERNRADREAAVRLRENLVLRAPVDGLVAARNAEPGTTVVAGQAVIEMIDPANLWVNARFDQIAAAGLRRDLPARIALRSHGGAGVAGRVLRVEVLADAVTEETLAKIAFDALPDPLPPLGELAEVTVELPALPAAPAIPNAAIRNVGGRAGVWKVDGGDVRFAAVLPGSADLDGLVQVSQGLAPGERVVVYSAAPLGRTSRIRVVTDPAELLR